MKQILNFWGRHGDPGDPSNALLASVSFNYYVFDVKFEISIGEFYVKTKSEENRNVKRQRQSAECFIPIFVYVLEDCRLQSASADLCLCRSHYNLFLQAQRIPQKSVIKSKTAFFVKSLHNQCIMIC